MTHIPVLTAQVLALFKAKAGDTLLDATLGQGGHAASYLKATSPDGRVVGLDADPAALLAAQANLAEYGDRVTYLNANFAKLKDSILGGGILPSQYSHILFDLGLGSHQLADTDRGFSFQSPGPLTMAYGQLADLPPSDLQPVNYLTEQLGHPPDALDLVLKLKANVLADLIYHYGEERSSRPVAQAIKQAAHPSLTASELAHIVRRALPDNYERGRIHPATRTFQALRLAVNRELEALQVALPQAVGLLDDGGTLAVISFHSLEDRIVKQYFKAEQSDPLIINLTKQPIRATDQEQAANPRSRSAKLRALTKIKTLNKHQHESNHPTRSSKKPLPQLRP